MRYIDILTAFEMEINKIDDTLNKPLVNDSLYWLNQAVLKFCKIRFSGSEPSVTSYEQTEKRTVDLLNLYTGKSFDSNEMEIQDTQPDFNSYNINYYTEDAASDVMFTLNEDVIITDNDGENATITSVFECTSDNFMYRVNNCLTDFHYRHHKARPLRIKKPNGCLLLTDKKYKILSYTIGYLRYPKKITMENPLDEYEDFPDVIMPEIIKMAAQMYIENKIPEQQRYQTIVNEVNTQE